MGEIGATPSTIRRRDIAQPRVSRWKWMAPDHFS
jgi:hypothetical protein